MNAYAKNFQCALDRARDRLLYCRKQRVAYEAYASDTEHSERCLRKLVEDEKRGQLDCAWAEHQLTEALTQPHAAFDANCCGD
jgi:hypothetical protein